MSEGYTIIHQPHRCPKPTTGDHTTGTVIRCNECGHEWSLSFFGWVPKREDEG